MNTAKINKTAETAARLTARAASLTVTQAITDTWNALTDEQRDDFTNSVDDIDSDAQYMGELWDGADLEGGESYRPLYYTRAQIDSARESYQKALAAMTALLATAE